MTHRPEDHQLLRDLLGEQRRDRFAPGFADRAAARWRAEFGNGGAAAGTIAFDAAVTRLFVRLVPLAAAAALILAVNNVRHRRDGQTFAQALIGAPTATTVARAASSVEAPRITTSTESAIIATDSAGTAPASLDAIYGLGTVSVSNHE